MPTEPRHVPVSPQPGAAERRPHIHGINEMPAGYDAEVADLFRDLRAATTLSETDLAVRLGTRPEVVQSLEQGALYALPAWPETCRVVNAYGALLNLDVRPLLRRIYSQLEAGIVELQPKQMPEVPVMVSPETRDHGFAAGNNAGGNNAGGEHAANPLDIPWPPALAPQAPSQNAWQNAQAAPAQQAPRPNVQMPPQPNAWPQAQPQAQPHPHPWPAQQPMPQGARPGGPPQYPGGQAPQPRPDGLASQPRPQPAQAPQARPQPRPQPQPQPPPQSRSQPQPQPQPEPHPLATDFTAEPAEPVEPKKKRKPALLKWGLGALIISAVAFAVWFALSQAPGPSDGQGAGQSQNGPLDPDDPRSRKADRLPSTF